MTKSPRKLNNSGFSLVELIISIAILAIIMIPLMSNFIRSKQLNHKAEEIQIQSNIAANVMEGLKTLSVKEIVQQFHGPEGNFDIIEQSFEEITRLNKISGGYEAITSTAEQATYYFAIHGMIEGGTAYDALITLDSVPYRKTAPGDPLKDILNDFAMPDIANLDVTANAILLSTGKTSTDAMDEEAYETFINRGEAYAIEVYEQSTEYQDYLERHDRWEDECEEYAMGGPEPSEEPAEPPFEASDARYWQYLDTERIKELTTKTLLITVKDDTIVYQINYECAWTSDVINNRFDNKISKVQYSKNMENIYLLYVPSKFSSLSNPDILQIDNLESEHPVNLFIAEQVSTTTQQPYITVRRDSAEDNIKVYTKLSEDIAPTDYEDYIDCVFRISPDSMPGIISDIVKLEKKDRIYEVTIQICEYVNSGNLLDKYKNVLYTLNSTKEE
ncbi:MAG: hypothetical protein K0S76_1321 [Herbinix sp.]|jgi:prepilin-type N-terminal cleavage/methylation domain-containing protein|nr:hypothetical protein [Herbinix sp.]